MAPSFMAGPSAGYRAARPESAQPRCHGMPRRRADRLACSVQSPRRGVVMIRLQKILVPTDFSECSQVAVRHGFELARTFAATVHLLHVVEDPNTIAWTHGF